MVAPDFSFAAGPLFFRNDSDLDRLGHYRAACPIYAVFLLTIAFTIYFPSVVLWLPKQVLPASVGCFPNPNGPGYICPP